MAELKLKQYMFSFKEGGWNVVWAKTLRGAKKLAQKEWNSKTLTVDVESVHLATNEGLETALRNFF